MVSVDTVAASHPCLPCPPRAETMADGLGWLLYALAQAGWHQGGHGSRHGWEVHLAAHFISVLCECYAGVIVVMAENRLITNINHKMF